MEEWDKKMANFGGMSEVEIMRLVCANAGDSGNVLVSKCTKHFLSISRQKVFLKGGESASKY